MKTVSEHDAVELSQFQRYLDDLNGDMSDQEFAKNWHRYLMVDTMQAEAYRRLHKKRTAHDQAQAKG